MYVQMYSQEWQLIMNYSYNGEPEIIYSRKFDNDILRIFFT